MHLRKGVHLAYCTNVHRGETWEETFTNLKTHVLAVRRQVAPHVPYAIGLRLGHLAAATLAVPGTLAAFRHWLDEYQCYVFTVNGFPYGPFHGTRVKEQVYLPDWTSPERLSYTRQLFEVMAELVPAGMEGGVSTVPGSFKQFLHSEEQVNTMIDQLWRCIDDLSALREATGRVLHLDLEPEPLCFLETSAETVEFFARLRARRPGDSRWTDHLRVNYDACHLAVEYEEPAESLARLRDAGIRIGKFHLSSALVLQPGPRARTLLSAFRDEVYLHQTVVRRRDGSLVRLKDLPELLARAGTAEGEEDAEWRVHYHVPLHAPASADYGTTQTHLLGVLDLLAGDPSLCSHLEMETYTWEVLPPELRSRQVVDQIVAEYEWTLQALRSRGLADG